MNILVIGSGGREHAIAWRLAQDPSCKKIYLAPGNAGAALEKNIEIIPIQVNEYDELVAFSLKNNIDLAVVGPDQALADGIVDKMNEKGIAAFGPSAEAAKIESSKAFAKQIMMECKIPTARFSVFTDEVSAKKYLEDCGWSSGWALKADGLALGKGVVVTQNLVEAQKTISSFLKGDLGEAGKKIIIEEKLIGKEASAFYLCDGQKFRRLVYACDYKQIGDGGIGPNTGGMGAYTPADWVSEALREEIEVSVVQPLLRGMVEKQKSFRGILFIGLMITEDGPRVLEFNARFGDPETQAFLPLVQGDLCKVLRATALGKLNSITDENISISKKKSVHVVAAAEGYPGVGGMPIRKGDLVEWNKNFAEEGIKIFFAGVKANTDGELLTNGGRVFGITAVAPTIEEARKKAYQTFQYISFSGLQKRSDIGL